jgi:DNA repair exonuclease SbcCD ATPase subunit
VITHAVGDAADAMVEVGEAIEKIKEDDWKFDQLDEDKASVQAPQKLALRRLDQLLDALKPDPRQARNQRQQRQRQQGQQGEGGDEGGGGGGGGGDGVPPLAELKLLRSLQADLNERTEEFSKKYPDAQNLTDPQKNRLDKLRRTQADLAALLDEMSQPGDPEPPPGPDPRDKAGPGQKDKPEGKN